MNLYHFFLLITSTVTTLTPVIRGSEIEAFHYLMRRATDNDSIPITTIMKTHAYKDSDKIVIIPKLFRLSDVQDNIKRKRLFVATTAGHVIGYKKLFCLENAKEREHILKNELRCIGSLPVACAATNTAHLIQVPLPRNDMERVLSSAATYIYSGADFTHPEHRSRGVNSRLTAFALSQTSEIIAEHIKNNQSSYLVLAYGLTQDNAGQEKDVLGGRTLGILKQFIPFTKAIAKITCCSISSEFVISRYRSFKPSFDPNSNECTPLSDEKSIPGYGCLIACSINTATAQPTPEKRGLSCSNYCKII